MAFSVSRDDIRRLEKAARDKDKRKLIEWADAFELAISRELQRDYDKFYKNQIANSLDLFIVTMLYTLATDGSVTIKKNKAEVYLDTFLKNFDKFRTEDVKPEDFIGRLKSLGINLMEYNYEQRVTSIVSFVISAEFEKYKKDIYQYFKDQDIIFLELDNCKGNELQIKKNVNILNMSDRIYTIGESELIDTYILYAEQIKKPVIDGKFIIEDIEEEN